MFKKNLEALQVKNPQLAKRLSETTFESIKDNIEVYQAESQDVIISYQGLALDDIYDPIRVAKTNWNMNVPKQLKKYDIVVVFGLGLGYLFKRAYISCDSRILMYEPKIDILRYVLEYVDFSKEISDDRVYFTDNRIDALNYITEKYLSEDNLVFLYPNAYAQLVTQEMSDFTNDIVEVCNLKKMDVNTIKLLAKQWAKHSLVNFTNMKNIRPISWLKDKFKNKVALITAAGPSLLDNIEKIKQNRDKFIVFSVNRAAKTLYQNGIKPDFVLFADVISIKHTISGIEDELNNTAIIADLRANNEVYKKFNNVFTYFSKNDLIAQHFSNITDNSFNLLETAGTATAQAYYCAKLLGMDTMIFAGLDLAFKGDVIYSDGQKVAIDAQNQVAVENSQKYKKNVLQVNDLNGNPVLTRDDYALFIRQFEDIFAQDNVSRIYNISDFGAYIKGMEYCSLENILENAEPLNISVSDVLNNFKVETTGKWNSIYFKISNVLKDEKERLANIKDRTTLLLNKELELLQQVSETNTANSDLEAELKNLSVEFSAFLPEVLADAFLSQYFQSEFVQFVNINNQSLNQGAETFIKLKNFEVELLNGLVEICDIWVKFLEEKM